MSTDSQKKEGSPYDMPLSIFAMAVMWVIGTVIAAWLYGDGWGVSLMLIILLNFVWLTSHYREYKRLRDKYFDLENAVRNFYGQESPIRTDIHDTPAWFWNDMFRFLFFSLFVGPYGKLAMVMILFVIQCTLWTRYLKQKIFEFDGMYDKLDVLINGEDEAEDGSFDFADEEENDEEEDQKFQKNGLMFTFFPDYIMAGMFVGAIILEASVPGFGNYMLIFLSYILWQSSTFAQLERIRNEYCITGMDTKDLEKDLFYNIAKKLEDEQ